MNLRWEDYKIQYSDEINQWLKDVKTNRFLEIDDWHTCYSNIINGVDFYCLNDKGGEKCFYKLNDDYYCKVVFKADQLIAIMNIYNNPTDRSVNINPIIVAPHLQGKGYGKAVIKDFINNVKDILQKEAFSRIYIMIEKENYSSRFCFIQCGFKHIEDYDNFEVYDYQLVD